MLLSTGYAGRLRDELSLRALAWAEKHALAHECTMGTRPNVIFQEDSQGIHGNFHPASYRRIQRKPEWHARLRKVHTTAARRLVSHDAARRELDTAVSSDALLMNIVCHPHAFALAPAKLSRDKSSLRLLLGTEAPERLHFGYKPRIPLLASHVERTEIDLRIGNLLLEAKLTESDFQKAPQARVERYRDFTQVFDPERLPTSNGFLLHYQLIRGVLAAHANPEFRYSVVCDARRADLIDAWFQVASAVRPADLRCRLQVVTWQEIAATLPPTMKSWLSGKYGIEC